jgi:hypothetical protein
MRQVMANSWECRRRPDGACNIPSGTGGGQWWIFGVARAIPWIAPQCHNIKKSLICQVKYKMLKMVGFFGFGVLASGGLFPLPHRLAAETAFALNQTGLSSTKLPGSPALNYRAASPEGDAQVRANVGAQTQHSDQCPIISMT